MNSFKDNIGRYFFMKLQALRLAGLLLKVLEADCGLLSSESSLRKN